MEAKLQKSPQFLLGGKIIAKLNLEAKKISRGQAEKRQIFMQWESEKLIFRVKCGYLRENP